MKKHLVLSSIIAFALCAPVAAYADGAEPTNGVHLYRGGAAGASAAGMTSENGVSVYRGAAPDLSLDAELSGGAPTAAAAPAQTVKVVVVHHYHAQTRRLRTQGFYSGHRGKSRRYTQGFYSGPVDKGRRRY